MSLSIAPPDDDIAALRLARLVIIALTLLRLVGLVVARTEFDFEEAQYWDWSRHFAFGYFSKPPLIAWIMGAAQAVCGSSEACIRAPAPLLYGGTSLLMLAALRRLYDFRTAMVGALLVALSPGVVFSARLMTTDVPLLFCTALAVYAIARLRARAETRFGVLLGLALGFGILAKYAMVYALGGLVVLGLVAPQERGWIVSRAMAIALGVAVVVVMPNLLWNLNNGFSTFLHTRENIEGGGVTFSLANGLAFFAAQFALAGPIVFAAALGRAFGRARTGHADADRLLLVFSAPVIAALTLYAFVVRANANWGAAGVLVAMALGAAVLVAHRRTALIWTSLAIGAVAQVALWVGDAMPERVAIPWLKTPNPYERVLGWSEIARKIERVRAQSGARAVVTEDRRHVALFTYYLREAGVGVHAWGHGADARNHFEATVPLARDTPTPVLFATQCANIERLKIAYDEVQPLGSVADSVARPRPRSFLLVKLGAPRGDIPPLPHC